MRVRIVGAGTVGGGLAAAAVRAGHAVTVAAEDAAAVDTVTADTGARTATSGVSAAEEVQQLLPSASVVKALRTARSLEERAFNVRLNAGNGWTWQSGWKLVGPTAAA